MIDQLPIYISVAFVLTTLLTAVLFYWTLQKSSSAKTLGMAKYFLIVSAIWLTIQAVLALNDVYKTNLDAIPPKIAIFGIIPMIITGVVCFLTEGGRRFIDSLSLIDMTYLSIVRVPVEIVLYWLFINQAIPELMTFEGRNFDIIAGLTAPLVAYFGITKGKMSRKALLAWNVICLGLLVNIVINALLSAPSPLQQFGMDQPNIALLNFPFCWLPTFVVPIVMFCQVASIRQLIKLDTNS